MPVYRVLASRTEFFVIEARIRAQSLEDAETRFYAVLWDDDEPLWWTQDLDSSDTQIDTIEPVPIAHDVIALGRNQDTICASCGGTVVYAPMSAEQSPGPWVHTSDSLLGQGVGL